MISITGRKVIIGVIALLVITIGTLSFLILKPSIGTTNGLGQPKMLLSSSENSSIPSKITSQNQVSEQTSSPRNTTLIQPAEKEMVRGLLPFFSAINTKDFQSMKKLHLGMRSISESELSTRLSSINSYTLQGMENVSQKGNTLMGLILYTADMNIPNTIGKNLAPYMSNVELIKEGDVWVIKSWVQITGEKGREGDVKYFNEVFAKMSSAEKRYGVKDLSKWAGLKE